MKINEQEIIYKKLDSDILSILSKKRNDYGDGIDVLSNFKQVSNIVKELKIDTTTPTGYALLMVILKLARITNLIHKNIPAQNESIDDSFIDGINYLKLAYCCFTEK